MNNYAITWMTDSAHDVNRVLAIEKLVEPFPMTADEIKAVRGGKHVIGKIAQVGTRADGFLLYEAVGDRVEVLRLSVHPDRRRRKLGTWLAGVLVGFLGQSGKQMACVRVRESNLGGQLFLKRMGYRGARVERGYYPDSGEDAYVFVYPFKAVLPAREVAVARGVV